MLCNMSKGNKRGSEGFPEYSIPLTMDTVLLRSTFLAAYYIAFLSDTKNPQPAFQALAAVASYWWEEGEPSPTAMVKLPWWVIDVLASGYMLYQDAAEAGRTTTLGEAYNLEGGGQGKEPRIKQKLRFHRDLHIALYIAKRADDGVSREQAIAEMADHLQMGESTIRRIWSKYKDRAPGYLAHLQTLNASRSD